MTLQLKARANSSSSPAGDLTIKLSGLQITMSNIPPPLTTRRTLDASTRSTSEPLINGGKENGTAGASSSSSAAASAAGDVTSASATSLSSHEFGSSRGDPRPGDSSSSWPNTGASVSPVPNPIATSSTAPVAGSSRSNGAVASVAGTSAQNSPAHQSSNRNSVAKTSGSPLPPPNAAPPQDPLPQGYASIYRLIDWLIDRFHRLICLIDWLIDLFHGLIDWLVCFELSVCVLDIFLSSFPDGKSELTIWGTSKEDGIFLLNCRFSLIVYHQQLFSQCFQASLLCGS